MKTVRNKWTFFACLWYIPILAAAWYISANVFPHKVLRNIFFGFGIEKDRGFNQQLFIHLCIGILAFSIFHVIGMIKGRQISWVRNIMAVMLFIAICSYNLGINLPIVTTTKFWIFHKDASLLQVLTSLRENGEIFLFTIMLLFTFIVPLVKMFALCYQVMVASSCNGNKVLSFISKWAMLDVLVMAVLISTMKSENGMVEITGNTGLVYFSLSVIMSMLVTIWISYPEKSTYKSNARIVKFI